MVSGAVAGDDLPSVARSASEALGRSVAIAVPALGSPLAWPPGGCAPALLHALGDHAAASLRGVSQAAPAGVSDCVPVRIGADVAGVVAALGERPLGPGERGWLEAAAAAAAVIALISVSGDGERPVPARSLLERLAAAPVSDGAEILAELRALGLDLTAGALALCARSRAGAGAEPLPEHPTALLAGSGARLLGLVAGPAPESVAASLAETLRERGMTVATSSPCQEPVGLHDAFREAELLLELVSGPATMLAGDEETYRLLIGVLLRNPAELERLRARTVIPLQRYDEQHDSELLATLQAFLAHHGSTTDTAAAMRLHRHTVGYRLARVSEVSGLSPYESDGRERLGLGLKAHQIIEMDMRRRRPG